MLEQIGLLNAEVLELGSDIYSPEAHFVEGRNAWFGIDITHPDGHRESFQAADPDDDADDIVE